MIKSPKLYHDLQKVICFKKKGNLTFELLIQDFEKSVIHKSKIKLAVQYLLFIIILYYKIFLKWFLPETYFYTKNGQENLYIQNLEKNFKNTTVVESCL